MRPYLAELARIAECYVSCYPNAGLPNAFGEYDEQPAETGELLQDFADQRLRQHRRRLLRHDARSHRARSRERSKASPPRPRPTADGTRRRASRRTRSSAGLEAADHPPRQQLPDDRRAHQRHRLEAKFARLIKDGNFTEAVDVALEQVRGGANIIDVNMDEGMLDSEQAMTTFLNFIATEPEIARVPIMIDSSKWSVLEAGLKCVQGKASSTRSA